MKGWRCTKVSARLELHPLSDCLVPSVTPEASPHLKPPSCSPPHFNTPCSFHLKPPSPSPSPPPSHLKPPSPASITAHLYI